MSETRADQGRDVGLERTVFPEEGHLHAVLTVVANAEFGLEVRPPDDEIAIGVPGVENLPFEYIG